MKIRITAQSGAQRIELIDTGRGIPRESIGRIFERFYTLDKSRTADAGGTGLGLAIAKRIVELHGAALAVESTVDVGTRFRFDLPTPVHAER